VCKCTTLTCFCSLDNCCDNEGRTERAGDIGDGVDDDDAVAVASTAAAVAASLSLVVAFAASAFSLL
jgi:hypothetical protein